MLSQVGQPQQMLSADIDVIRSLDVILWVAMCRQMKAKADAAAKAKERVAEEGLHNADGTHSPVSKFHGVADIDEALAQEEGPAKNPIMRWWQAMKATKCAQAIGNNSFIKHLTYVGPQSLPCSPIH